MRKTGFYEYFGNVQHFIPFPLPPKDPEFVLTSEILNLYGEVTFHLGKLNEAIQRIPDINRFIKSYIIKEALLSSSIEGINTTLLEVYTQPLLSTKPSENVQLIINYKRALEAASSLIKDKNMPVSSRVILEAHKVLMDIDGSAKADPGNYRKQSVKVGTLVPPPASYISKLMSDLEYFINIDTSFSPIIKAGLVHVQFETIHPFLDGNGRIGRLLIILMLLDNDILKEPVIYLSYYFKKQRLDYYNALKKVQTDGDFEGWIIFYLKALKECCIDTYTRSKEIENLNIQLINTISNRSGSQKLKENMFRALNIIFTSPVINIKELSIQLNVAYNTASKIISDFVEYGILIETSNNARNRLFLFFKYLNILEKEY